MSKKNGLADPIRLKPLNGDNKQLLRVVIETPKGRISQGTRRVLRELSQALW